MDPSIAASGMLEGVRRFLYPWASSTLLFASKFSGLYVLVSALRSVADM